MGISLPGLASNLDTASLINAIMSQERVPYKNFETKKTAVTNNKTIFNNINLKLKALRDAAINLSDVDSFKANGANISDSSKLTALVDSSTATGNYAIKIITLAKQQVNATNAIALNDSDGKKIKLSSDDIESEIRVEGINEPFILKNMGLTLDNTMEEALNKVANEINKNKDSNVQASVIQTADGAKSIVLMGKESGKSIAMSGTGLFSTLTTKVNAEPATIEINGVPITSSSNTIKDAIHGVTLQLLADKSSVNMEIKQDQDKIAEKVQAFVDAYNNVVSLIRENTKKITNEKNSDGSYKNFKTNLQGDSMLRDLQREMGDIISSVTGPNDQYRLLDQIGIEIDKGITRGAEMTGKISFDKALFKQKLADNPSVVEEMFKGDRGLATLFKDSLNNYTKVNGLMQSKLDGYDSEIKFIDSQMESLQTRLTLREEALKKQYAQLEVNMSKLNSQKTWMTNQLAALTASAKSS
ncbi:flagellar hook-associated protein 2 [Fontibacillus solani]|uniref:Flagellar hook-associated protein 2 n=1 Tax=Fontibacillus solani TaxID=1572857 RepID=A0A7W3STA4_9BACL|nr:flagellar filament capping protein FliD [Fontibacillus solani]MBA9085780.1 flagellar hook-associated protein 2 [Fontibacillus solani]